MTNTLHRRFNLSIRFGTLVALAVGGLLSLPSARAAEPVVDQAYLREHYTKYEHQITMRDGIRLFTAVYAPKDTSAAWPILLTRTPYSVKPYGVDQYPTPRGPMANYAKENFIFVLQDVRGHAARRGSSATSGRTTRPRPARTTSTKAPTATTRSTGWSSTCRTTTAASG